MKTNCPNCGAVYEADNIKCPYCGTTYIDLTAIDLDKPFMLRMKHDKMFITYRAIVSNAEICMEYDDVYAMGAYGHKMVNLTRSMNIVTNLQIECVGDDIKVVLD